MNSSSGHKQATACWAVVPAAGVGKRMQSAVPKQYLPLYGRVVIEHTLQRLAAHAAIEAIVVATSDDDSYWPEIQTEYIATPVYRVAGGVERCHSVLNALIYLQDKASHGDWVLVHDAARPCLRHTDIDLLIATVTRQGQGGLLGMPVRDTMKQVDAANRVEQTIDRSRLWHALTPQMFRLGDLHAALQAALANNQLVTDEASAMELAGIQPLLVEGHGDNIKITRPQDLDLAEFYLQQQAMAENNNIDDGG